MVKFLRFHDFEFITVKMEHSTVLKKINILQHMNDMKTKTHYRFFHVQKNNQELLIDIKIITYPGLRQNYV